MVWNVKYCSIPAIHIYSERSSSLMICYKVFLMINIMCCGKSLKSTCRVLLTCCVLFKKKNFMKKILSATMASGHADSFGFMCWCFEISIVEIFAVNSAPRKWKEFTWRVFTGVIFSIKTVPRKTVNYKLGPLKKTLWPHKTYLNCRLWCAKVLALM